MPEYRGTKSSQHEHNQCGHGAEASIERVPLRQPMDHVTNGQNDHACGQPLPQPAITGNIECVFRFDGQQEASQIEPLVLAQVTGMQQSSGVIQLTRIAKVNAHGLRLIPRVDASFIQTRSRPCEFSGEDRTPSKFPASFVIRGQQNQFAQFIEHNQFVVGGDDSGLSDSCLTFWFGETSPGIG